MIGDLCFERLEKMGLKAEGIDSHQVRVLFPDVGFTRVDRSIYIERIGHLVSVLETNGISVVASFVSPYAESRDFVRTQCRNFIEAHVNASVEICRSRDQRGLYSRAVKGEIPNFTGVSDMYEEPQKPEIVIDADRQSPDEAARRIFGYIKKEFLS